MMLIVFRSSRHTGAGARSIGFITFHYVFILAFLRVIALLLRDINAIPRCFSFASVFRVSGFNFPRDNLFADL